MFEDLITDRTLEDVQNRTAKGHYNATDLNRVEHAANQISEMLTKEAYPVVYQPHIRKEITEIWDENSILLLHGNDFIDSSKKNIEIINSGVQISTQQSKFGGSSFYFDGDSWLECSIDALGLNFNNEWTLEWWDKPNSNSGSNSAVFCMPNVTKGFVAYSVDTTKVRLFAGNNDWDFIPVTQIGTYNGTVWTHRAICKSGTKILAFENGKKKAEITTTGNLIMTPNLYIGYRKNDDRQGGFIGYLDEIRISNIARYTSNFDVQTSEFVVKKTIIKETEGWLEPENYQGKPDHPTESEMNRYLHNIEEIKRQFYQKKSTPALPKQMSRLKHSGANAIEQLIVDTNDLLIETEKEKRKSGTFKAGELLP